MLPFDKRYRPDMMFKINMPMIQIFPEDVGKGMLMLNGTLENLVTECWIIDDYCIQFSCEFVHVYEMYNKKYKKYSIANLDESDITWLTNALNESYRLQQSFNRLHSNPKNDYDKVLVKTYSRILSTIYHLNMVSIADYKTYKENVSFLIDRLNNALDITFEGGSFYSNSKRIDWGTLGRDLTSQILQG